MSNLLSKLKSLNQTCTTRDEYVRAPMGYPGAKTRSIKQLNAVLPYRNTFIDVCGGSGSVLLSRDFSPLEIFNDRHSGIVALYRCVRDSDKFRRLMERLEIAPPQSREEFMWSRDSWQVDNTIDDVERAARYYYTLRHSFGQKSWAFGRATAGTGQSVKYYRGLDLFGPLHNRLKNVLIENMDWRQVLTDFKSGGKDVVWYLDPPYWKTSNIYDHEWTEADHLELCERIQDLNGGYVAVSGYDDPAHPYNRFKFWTAKYQWEVAISMTGMAFTETNNLLAYKDDIKRGTALETLWVYDPKG